MPAFKQLDLFAVSPEKIVDREWRTADPRQRLAELLQSDLDFRGENTLYFPHGIHGFPAKFPPQLPRKFILHLTRPGEIVLDPMVGSGTTVVEAVLCGRVGIGVDIDPVALMLTQAKVCQVSAREFGEAGKKVVLRASKGILTEKEQLLGLLDKRFDSKTKEFVDYWFRTETQVELIALVREIELVDKANIRRLLEVAFSSTIIAKSGGVSLARDLAHTRPHRDLQKPRRSAIELFAKRVDQLVRGLAVQQIRDGMAVPVRGDALSLPLRDESVDLVVTSPPYASNAIDYMRAHKFSLVWFGRPLEALTKLRSEYIGHDSSPPSESVPSTPTVSRILSELSARDARKARILAKYFQQMSQVLAEIRRVLKKDKVAVLVVGSSVMRGLDTQIGGCLGEIGEAAGLELVGTAKRMLDRDKRMMPAQWASERRGIEARMHHEDVLGFVRPAS